MIVPMCRQIFRSQGWTLHGRELANHPRSVVVGAPHTSNWDFVYLMATFDLLDLPLRFTIKDSWLRFPMNLLLEPLGALGIDRRPRDSAGDRPSMVEEMIRIFEQNPGEMALMITPEATRSANDRWKSGFYHVARGADVPILLGYLDYEKRESGVGKVLDPRMSFDEVMQEATDFYSSVTGYHPERFSVDTRYA